MRERLQQKSSAPRISPICKMQRKKLPEACLMVQKNIEYMLL